MGVPVEPEQAAAARQQCKLMLELLAAYTSVMIWCLCLCGTKHSAQQWGEDFLIFAFKPCLALGLAYDITKVALHTISALRCPPLRLSKGGGGEAIVRSLSAHEAQTTVFRPSDQHLGA